VPKIAIGILIIVGTLLQLPAFAIIPLAIRDQYIGSGFIALAWLIGGVGLGVTGGMLIGYGIGERYEAKKARG
jgi:hypothetical protein